MFTVARLSAGQAKSAGGEAAAILLRHDLAARDHRLDREGGQIEVTCSRPAGRARSSPVRVRARNGWRC